MGLIKTGTRSFDNLFTGIGLTGAGKSLAYLGAGTALTYQYAKKNLPEDPLRFANSPTGIVAPLAHSFDGRSTPTMGADGALTLALSKLR